jgi:hypothetical protein
MGFLVLATSKAQPLRNRALREFYVFGFALPLDRCAQPGVEPSHYILFQASELVRADIQGRLR